MCRMRLRAFAKADGRERQLLADISSSTLRLKIDNDAPPVARAVVHDRHLQPMRTESDSTRTATVGGAGIVVCGKVVM